MENGRAFITDEVSHSACLEVSRYGCSRLKEVQGPAKFETSGVHLNGRCHNLADRRCPCGTSSPGNLICLCSLASALRRSAACGASSDQPLTTRGSLQRFRDTI